MVTWCRLPVPNVEQERVKSPQIGETFHVLVKIITVRVTVVLEQWQSVVIGSTNGNYFRQWLLVWLTVSHKTFMVITTFLTPPPSHCC